jgi:hypothetical protein
MYIITGLVFEDCKPGTIESVENQEQNFAAINSCSALW